jgi:hypothetical protein
MDAQVRTCAWHPQSPAVSENALFLRTKTHLYRIESGASGGEMTRGGNADGARSDQPTRIAARARGQAPWKDVSCGKSGTCSSSLKFGPDVLCCGRRSTALLS